MRVIDEDAIRRRWDTVGSKLDERGRRLFAAAEVRTAGSGRCGHRDGQRRVRQRRARNAACRSFASNMGEFPETVGSDREPTDAQSAGRRRIGGRLAGMAGTAVGDPRRHRNKTPASQDAAFHRVLGRTATGVVRLEASASGCAARVRSENGACASRPRNSFPTTVVRRSINRGPVRSPSATRAQQPRQHRDDPSRDLPDSLPSPDEASWSGSPRRRLRRRELPPSSSQLNRPVQHRLLRRPRQRQEPGVRVSRRDIPVMTQHYPMLQRNLLYTGVTRGKKLVVLVGQKKAVAIAVRNASGRRRWSKLDDWLRLGASRAPPLTSVAS